MTKKQSNLQKIRTDINAEIEKHELPLATINSLKECLYSLRYGTIFITFKSEVAKWFEKYDFIYVKMKDQINYVIGYDKRLG